MRKIREINEKTNKVQKDTECRVYTFTEEDNFMNPMRLIRWKRKYEQSFHEAMVWDELALMILCDLLKQHHLDLDELHVYGVFERELDPVKHYNEELKNE